MELEAVRHRRNRSRQVHNNLVSEPCNKRLEIHPRYLECSSCVHPDADVTGPVLRSVPVLEESGARDKRRTQVTKRQRQNPNDKQGQHSSRI